MARIIRGRKARVVKSTAKPKSGYAIYGETRKPKLKRLSPKTFKTEKAAMRVVKSANGWPFYQVKKVQE